MITKKWNFVSISLKALIIGMFFSSSALSAHAESAKVKKRIKAPIIKNAMPLNQELGVATLDIVNNELSGKYSTSQISPTDYSDIHETKGKCLAGNTLKIKSNTATDGFDKAYFCFDDNKKLSFVRVYVNTSGNILVNDLSSKYELAHDKYDRWLNRRTVIFTQGKSEIMYSYSLERGLSRFDDIPMVDFYMGNDI
ncbi:hypothetical protein [Aquitalea sp.]|uniref:hypothetical protein n=1 Tax=Aquitalea sp. TaxID=1872623 RepID=UPI0025908C50|nr:hypothetical protein [Aquitalea sp.]